MPIRTEQLAPLTSLRFFAALAVFVYHAYMYAGARRVPPPQGLVHLATGVTFFFVLSGFILTYNYLNHLRYPTVRGTWNFWVARWARIWPLHVLAIILILPALNRASLRSGAAGDPVWVTIANLTLIQAWFPDQRPIAVFNPAAWTLSGEWFFYLCFPLLIWGLSTGSYVRRVGVLVIAVAPWAIAFGGVMGWTSFGATIGHYAFVPTRLLDFVVGVLLGLYWHYRRDNRAVAESAGRRGTLLELAAVLVLCVWAAVCVGLCPDRTWAYRVNWIGVYLAPFAILIWVFAKGAGRLSRLLSARPLVWLGEVSFAFYMLHLAVMTYAIRHGGRFGYDQLSWQERAVVIGVLTLGVSAVCYHLCEMPSRRLLRRWMSVREERPVPQEQPVETLSAAVEPPLTRAA